ncbi:SpaH/EbpB family LPXTG-anchored major pilin [Thermophilibacter provencensis]|uniref:SpaH/EbpB family LPXTG-anchored major pilin n=1 Tax=Thermophilibacter provencensis TaxID=1852386 RepID=UPI00094B74C9|nr:SpaH/EbpB family LPXTG-anchored major pilin [Thermophilibacter provencensis]
MAHIKNRLRGLLVAFVALVAALAIAPGVAQAEPTPWTGGETKTITVSNLQPGDVVTLYKVADVQLNDDNTTTLVVQTGFEQDTVDAYLDAAGSETAQDVWEDRGDASPFGTAATVQDGQTSVIFSNVDAGLYLVDVVPADESVTYQPTIVAMSPVAVEDTTDWTFDDAYIDLKKSTTTLDKKITGGAVQYEQNGGKLGYAMVGDEVTFQVTFEINANQSEFVLTDTMSTGLTFTGAEDVVLYKNGQIVPAEGVYTVSDNEGDQSFTVNFDTDWLQEKSANGTSVNAGTYTIEYKGLITPEATLDGVTNTVTSTNNADGDTVTVDFVGFDIVKYGDADEDSKYDEGEDLLSGAEFALYYDQACQNPVYKKDSTTQVTLTTVNGEASTDADTLLEPGTYYLMETAAPSGYQIVANPIEIEVTAEGGTFYIPNVASTDHEGIELPTTGGMGTVALTAAGVVLVAGAAAFIVRFRKEN